MKKSEIKSGDICVVKEDVFYRVLVNNPNSAPIRAGAILKSSTSSGHFKVINNNDYLSKHKFSNTTVWFISNRNIALLELTPLLRIMLDLKP